MGWKREKSESPKRTMPVATDAGLPEGLIRVSDGEEGIITDDKPESVARAFRSLLGKNDK